MARQLVLVHGRAQEDKDAGALKSEWLEAFASGLAKNGLRLPFPEESIRFPYYGNTLRDLVEGHDAASAAQIIVRGDATDNEVQRFVRAWVEQIKLATGITDDQLAATMSQQIVERGPENWEWVQGVLRAIDRFVPYGSGASIALFTRDVYRYLNDEAIRHTIELGVSQAMTPGVETVVVSHSLGTVVTYNLLRREGHKRGWKVPLLVTLGSPLGITEIRQSLRRATSPLGCPQCVSAWFNAMDERDVVALYPLDTQCFPLEPKEPAIQNKIDVRNRTRNRHGIAGYLDDAEVAKRIYDASI